MKPFEDPFELSVFIIHYMRYHPPIREFCFIGGNPQRRGVWKMGPLGWEIEDAELPFMKPESTWVN